MATSKGSAEQSKSVVECDRRRADWDIVSTFLLRHLDGKQAAPSASETMAVYDAEYALETSYGFKYRLVPGLSSLPSAQFVRSNVVELVRTHKREHPLEEREAFRLRWQQPCRFVFSYHDRHYVKRAQGEKPKERRLMIYPHFDFQDDGAVTIFDLGMLTWDATSVQPPPTVPEEAKD